jgi:hypothetical protein
VDSTNRRRPSAGIKAAKRLRGSYWRYEDGKSTSRAAVLSQRSLTLFRGVGELKRNDERSGLRQELARPRYGDLRLNP